MPACCVLMSTESTTTCASALLKRVERPSRSAYETDCRIREMSAARCGVCLKDGWWDCPLQEVSVCEGESTEKRWVSDAFAVCGVRCGALRQAVHRATRHGRERTIEVGERCVPKTRAGKDGRLKVRLPAAPTKRESVRERRRWKRRGVCVSASTYRDLAIRFTSLIQFKFILRQI